MPKFFENESRLLADNCIALGEENAHHCARVLRMKCGEAVTVCIAGVDYACVIRDIAISGVLCEVMSSEKCTAEPSVNVTLFQCLPKGDKLETVIQKAVELGVYAIQPVLSRRCVSRPDEQKSKKKTDRYRKIALSACEQSGRGRIVEVMPTISFEKAVEMLPKYDTKILFFEGGGAPLREIVSTQSAGKQIAVLIGPEGGFDRSEVELAVQNGAVAATLGARILRTETAPIAALTAVMLLSGNMD